VSLCTQIYFRFFALEIASLVGLGPKIRLEARSLMNMGLGWLGLLIELGPCIRTPSPMYMCALTIGIRNRDAREEEQKSAFFSFIDLTRDNGNNGVYETITVVRTRAKQLTASVLSVAEIALETLLFLIQSTPQPSGRRCRPALRYCQHEDIP
jgi:hypothetical protein